MSEGLKNNKNIHVNHRKRLKESVNRDCELETFSDVEVLEYLLTFVIPRKDTNPIAHELLDTFGSIFGVLSASKNELYEIKNMTANAAHLLPNLTAIVRRAGLSRIKENSSIKLSEDAVKILEPYFINRNSERLYMMCIDLHDKLMQIDLLSEGLSNFTTVDFSKVVSIATRVKPSKVILAHNHPGGSISPSNEDISLTESLSLILSTIGVKLIDHLIFADDKYYSFYEHNITLEHLRKTDSICGTDYYKEVRSRKDFKRYVLESDKKSD